MAIQFRVLFFHPPKWAQQPPKTSQRRPKRYSLDTLFYDFGAPGGNVKTMTSCRLNHSFHSWSGSPETPEAFKKTLQKNIQNKLRTHTTNIEKCAQGTPRGAQRAVNEPTFSSLFRLGPFRGALGSPRVAKRPQQTPNDPPRVPK